MHEVCICLSRLSVNIAIISSVCFNVSCVILSASASAHLDCSFSSSIRRCFVSIADLKVDIARSIGQKGTSSRSSYSSSSEDMEQEFVKDRMRLEQINRESGNQNRRLW